MKEDTIRRFFEGEVTVDCLAEEALRSVARVDEITTNVAIEDMPHDFHLTRNHILALCDAGIAGGLNQEAMSTIAFALIASDRFEWDDDIISETLWDWSSPETNCPLEPNTLQIHRSWLVGAQQLASKPALTLPLSQGRLLSRREKVHS